jgi:Ca2+:H+ antiporter
MYLYFQLRTHKNLFSIEVAQEAAGEDESEPAMSPWSAGAVLIATTLVIAVCAEFLVDSIDDLVETAHISKNFIGLILIPIVGNAAEHVTACVVAVRNKMDLVSSPRALMILT